jgi:inner membrane transporter RhtA
MAAETASMAEPGRHRRSILAGVVATVLGMVAVQSGAAIAIALFSSVGALGVVALRLGAAAAFLMGTSRPPLRRLGWHQLLPLGGLGVVIAAMNASFYLALERVPLGVAVALEMVGPIAIAIAGSRRARDIGIVALAVPGVLVLALAHGVNGPVTTAGILLALGAGACWAGYIALSARAARRLPGAQGLAVAMVVATGPALLVAAISAGSDLLDARVLVLGAAVGLLSTAFPGTLDALALRRLRSATYALVLSVAPAVAALTGLAFQGQRLSIAQWAGIMLVMVASAAAVAGAEPPDVPAPERAS